MTEIGYHVDSQKIGIWNVGDWRRRHGSKALILSQQLNKVQRKRITDFSKIKIIVAVHTPQRRASHKSKEAQRGAVKRRTATNTEITKNTGTVSEIESVNSEILKG